MSITAARFRARENIPEVLPDNQATQKLRELENGANRIENLLDWAQTASSLAPMVFPVSWDLDPTANDSLSQIGDSPFYWSGNEPVDPRNCDLWPNSPYCGGSAVDPLDWREIGIEGRVTVSLCETCLQVGGRFFGVSGPPAIVCWRNEQPACNPPAVQQPGKEKEEEDRRKREKNPSYFEGAARPFSGARVVFAGNLRYTHLEVIRGLWEIPSGLSQEEEDAGKADISQQILDLLAKRPIILEPGITRAPMVPHPVSGAESKGWAGSGGSLRSYGGWQVSFGAWDTPINDQAMVLSGVGGVQREIRYLEHDCNLTVVAWDDIPCQFLNGGVDPFAGVDLLALQAAANNVVAGRLAQVARPGLGLVTKLFGEFVPDLNPSSDRPLSRFKAYSEYPGEEDFIDDYVEAISMRPGTLVSGDWLFEKEAGSTPSVTPPPFLQLYSFNTENCGGNKRPPGNQPLPTPPEDDMACCDETLELLEAIYNRLGCDEFPVSAPPLLIQEDEKTIELGNHAQLWEWTARNLDAVMGQFPIKIKIKDSDPTQEGNQEVTVALPNLAEGIAELFGLVYQAEMNTDLVSEMLLRLIPEVLATKNAALIGQSYSKANASFLGYKLESKEVDVDYNFDLEEAQSLPRFLNEVKKRITVPQDVSKESVLDILAKLEFAAGIIKSAFYVKPSESDRLLQAIETMLVDEALSIPNKEQWRDWLQRMNRDTGKHNTGQSIQPEIIEDLHEGFDKL